MHQPVDIAIGDHVQGVSAARNECTASHRGNHERYGWEASAGCEHGRNGLDKQLLDYPRFGKGEVTARSGCAFCGLREQSNG